MDTKTKEDENMEGKLLSQCSITDLEREIARRKEAALDNFKDAVEKAYMEGLETHDLEHIIENF